MSPIERRWWITVLPTGRALRVFNQEQDADISVSFDQRFGADGVVEVVPAEQLRGAVGTLEQARDEFRAALAADESAEYLRDLMHDFIAVADAALGGR